MYVHFRLSHIDLSLARYADASPDKMHLLLYIEILLLATNNTNLDKETSERSHADTAVLKLGGAEPGKSSWGTAIRKTHRIPETHWWHCTLVHTLGIDLRIHGHIVCTSSGHRS